MKTNKLKIIFSALACSATVAIPIVTTVSCTTNATISKIDGKQTIDTSVHQQIAESYTAKDSKGNIVPSTSVTWTLSGVDADKFVIKNGMLASKNYFTSDDMGVLKVTINAKYGEEESVSFDVSVNVKETNETFITTVDGQELFIPYSQSNVKAFCDISLRSKDFTFVDKSGNSTTIKTDDIVGLSFGEEWAKGLDEKGVWVDTNGDATGTDSGTRNVKNYLPNDFLSQFFILSKHENISLNLSGLDKVTEVGNNFCKEMFDGCTHLKTISSNLTMPQGITTTGDFFASEMFDGCVNLTSLPTNFNLPQDIDVIGESFANKMFVDCSNLTYLPSNFNMPQGITDVKNNFAYGMFKECSRLIQLPENFNLPSSIADPAKIGNNFGYQMFYDCSSLVTLPGSFTFPEIIIGEDTAYFAFEMFYNCSSISSDKAGNDVAIVIPNANVATAHYCERMFYGCDVNTTSTPSNWIDTDVKTPKANTTVHFN